MTTAPGPGDALVGLCVGHYRIEAALGAGGMGLVYRARHVALSRGAAIKVLRPELAGDRGMAETFSREARTLSALKHPNVVDIVDFGTLPDGRHYMVMELLEGWTLADELRRRRMPHARALEVAIAVLQGLEAAHSLGIMHRDLKPSNLFVARGLAGVERVKLIDFGLARAPVPPAGGADAPMPGGTALAGTAEYMAPEQAAGDPPNPASDLYAFGVTLFELLTGTRPFEAKTPALRSVELLVAHLRKPPPTLAQRGAAVPAELEALVAELLAKAPADRPRSAREVRRRLSVIAASMEPPPRAPRRRGPVLVGAGALVAGLAVVLAFGPQASAPPGAVAAPPSAPEAEADDRRDAPSNERLAPHDEGRTPDARLAARRAAPTEDARGSVVEPEAQHPAGAVTRERHAQPDALRLDAPHGASAAAAEDSPRKRRRAFEPDPATASAASPPAEAEPQYPPEDCSPDDDWRRTQRGLLLQLQALAAQGDAARWEEFNRVEPVLSAAIDSAATASDCQRVEARVVGLARRWAL